MRLYLIRHADPDYANNTITPAGHLEAAALARRMAALRPDFIYTSPAGRARDTMRHTADLLHMPHEVLDWTTEIGDWTMEQDGQPNCIWNIHGQRVRSAQKAISRENWHTIPPFDKPRFRSSFESLMAKSDSLFAGHGYLREGRGGGQYRIARPNPDRLAVFCHGGFGLAWLSYLLDIPLPLAFAAMTLPTSSVTTVVFDESSGQVACPRAIGIGDISHLYAAGLPMSSQGILAYEH